jgi:hypothetical protein
MMAKKALSKGSMKNQAEMAFVEDEEEEEKVKEIIQTAGESSIGENLSSQVLDESATTYRGQEG